MRAAYLGFWRDDVENGADWQEQNVQDDEDEDDYGVHFGDFADSRVPDFHQLLLTVRMSHKLIERESE